MPTLEAETLEQQNGHTAVESAVRPLRLDIGGGDKPAPGHVLIDRMVGKEAFPLDYPDGSVDEVRAVHVLEHLGYSDAQAAVKEWVRVLKPGGRLRIAVPDAVILAHEVLAGNPDAIRWIYGGQTDPNDFHKNCFNEGGLRFTMEKYGLIGVQKWESDQQDCSALPVSLNLEGFKPTEMAVNADKTRTIHAVMSMPRLGFADNMFAALRVFTPLGVEFTRHTSAFWDQSMERVIGQVLDANPAAEWIVTLDYDTVFNRSMFQRLAMLFELHPEYDALFPMQARRGPNSSPICNRKQETTVGDLMADVVPMDSGHFGLTFFRASALRKLPHPWFVPIPNTDGKWEEGRVDSDIRFWQHFKANGLRAGVAPKVGVGHLELMVSWVNDEFKTVYQPIPNWDETGAPRGTVC